MVRPILITAEGPHCSDKVLVSHLLEASIADVCPRIKLSHKRSSVSGSFFGCML